ncbi:hypothetical protein ACF1AJ_11020 [Leifsonia sp. NPDC014704]|uniref:hypothetical protein n=1 Tax=Leifsonia sp. NPDC014704 TaxID=3364123 RepID=UPI0036F4A3E0
MQLTVVLLVLPPLITLARTGVYRPLRIVAALLTAAAATGWLLDRVGLTTPLGTAADSLGSASPWIVGALWIAAAGMLVRRRLRRPALVGAVRWLRAVSSLWRDSRGDSPSPE